MWLFLRKQGKVNFCSLESVYQRHVWRLLLWEGLGRGCSGQRDEAGLAQRLGAGVFNQEEMHRTCWHQQSLHKLACDRQAESISGVPECIQTPRGQPVAVHTVLICWSGAINLDRIYWSVFHGALMTQENRIRKTCILKAQRIQISYFCEPRVPNSLAYRTSFSVTHCVCYTGSCQV